ncbi:MAG: fasciclin domain-containing protein [Chitinophagaceae bacterium]|nr:MAG: fasciclin domain-containing protein [Chitinophagaceae bacterium]
MKRFSIKSFLMPAFLGMGIIAFSSCENDDDVTTPSGTVTQVVVGADNFSTLESAVIKANLSATLDGAGPFTVFAPDNNAFTASGVTPAVLNSLTADQVKTILLYHTLTSKVTAANVPAGPNAKVITASGDSVFVTKKAGVVYINGVKVAQADINATNGVIHRIERVLMPASGNIVATAQMPGSGLDSLVKAVTVAATAPGGDPAILTMLQNSTLTVFAPNNAAFTQLLSALSLNNISNIPIGTLTAVLKYHLVAGRAFSSDLTNGNISMAAGGTTAVNLTNGSNGGPTITGNGNAGAKANIVATNMVARNGVVHVIDKVLLP